MRAHGAWKIDFRKRPYRKIASIITIWSFLMSTLFPDPASSLTIKAISPTSSFNPIPYDMEKDASSRPARDAKKPLKELFMECASYVYMNFQTAKAVEDAHKLSRLEEIIKKIETLRPQVKDIAMRDGFYITYKRDEKSPEIILHYFSNEKRARTFNYATASFGRYKNIFVEILTKEEYEAIKKNAEIFFSPEGACENEVIKAIEGAKAKIDIAMYSFTNENIARALVEAKKRGVRIRLFLDKEQEKKDIPRHLKESGIETRYDKRYGLMHNKFMIIDRKAVISGSYNWTHQAEKENRENLIILPYIDDFRTEFEWLLSGAPRSPPNIRAPPSDINAFFSPKGGCEEEVLRLIRLAKEEKITHPEKPQRIDIALYYFTNKDIADELFDTAKKGADIRILLDKGQKRRNDSIEKYLLSLEKKSDKHEARRGNLEIRYYRIRDGLMHNKFAVIGDTTLTGSYNWTKSAENKNRENLIVLPYAVKGYQKEFNRLWSDSDKVVNF